VTNNSKLNYLSKSFEEKSNHFKLNSMQPASLAEESSLFTASSSSSHSSTPSSSISKTNLLNTDESHIVLLSNDKEKLKKFVDENNNNKQWEHNLNNMIDMKTINKKAKNNDSIRMRHNSSKALTTDSNVPFIEVVNSNSVLVNSGNLDSQSSSDDSNVRFSKSSWKQRNEKRNTASNYFIISLLFVVNLLNYIDRYTLAGVLREIQEYFSISDGESGLLQTVFICSYMLLAPLFGYLGDRYSRKWLIVFGISFWSFMTFIGSFVPRDKFWLFVIIRSLVGIGEASYSCVAPTIIGDLFASEVRTRMLALFYLAVPVGSGMGYIVGSNIAQLFDNDWRWALRFTPGLGFICVILLIFFCK